MTPKRPAYVVFCDESRTSQYRYMVFGGIVMPNENLRRFNKAMEGWRERTQMRRELKWKKVSSQKLPEYRALVDNFFRCTERDFLHFKAVVFDTHEIDYSYHENDWNLGYYRFMYTFLCHKFGPYARDDDHRLIVVLDRRTSAYKLNTLRHVLNHGIKKNQGRRTNVVRRVEAIDSKQCEAMQMADVIMGAVGWHCNDCDAREEASQAKCELADYIAAKAGVARLTRQTGKSEKRFEIWRFRWPQKRKRPGA